MGKLIVCFLICLVEFSLHVVSCHGSRHLLEIYTPAHINGSTDSYSSNEVNIESQCTETANAYVYTLKVPGFNKEDVKVESETGILRIKGENKKCEKSADEVHWSYGHFWKQFVLANDAEVNDIQTNFTDGVLTVTVGKRHHQI
ncbi:hypothetical protein FRX31_033835 [Thalictrum thalictroides]|uniref:SHSP domain-containing protein n=1 Tax=Thalictrum thalictroides TaxID=46969 RepID=A0A7J6UVK9_THATH|nr:hypothetical protein FRX31_033835 [Thalictrum thalictroides]